MKHYQCRRVTLSYDSNQDRIRCLCYANDGQVLSVWITRKLIVKAMPVIAQWLVKYKASVANRVAENNSSEAALWDAVFFDYDVAQYQVSVEYSKMSNRPETAIAFLLYKVSLSVNDRNKIELTLADQSNLFAAVFILIPAELYRFISELVHLTDTADWKVPHPWPNLALIEARQVIH